MRKKLDSKAVVRACRKIAKAKYGATNLHLEQRRMIRSLARGKDVMGVIPTGSGKSLCYQAPALAMNAMSLIITPLKALMRDQVMRARKRGFKAAYIASGDDRETESALEELESGSLDLLYVSPERFRMEGFVKAVKSATIGLIAVDESDVLVDAHSQFRPSYGYIGETIDRIFKARKRPPILALTATATLADREVIAEKLHLKPTYRAVVADPVRDNIQYRIVRGDNWSNVQRLAAAWRAGGMVGRYVIYCGSRAATEMVAARINTPDSISRAYHAGMDERTRRQIEEGFANNRYKVIVATNAFGRGVDVPDIREVVFFGPCKSVEELVQGWGRGGRDGLPAIGTMLFDQKGLDMQKRLVQSSVPRDEVLECLWETVCEAASDADEEIETGVFDLYDTMKKSIPNLTPYEVEPALLSLDAMGALVYRRAESGEDISIEAAAIKTTLPKLRENLRKVAEALLSRIPKGALSHRIWFDADDLGQSAGVSSRFVRRAIVALAEQYDAVSLTKKYDRILLKVKKLGLPAAQVIDYKMRDEYQIRLFSRLKCVVELAYADDPKAYVRNYFGYKPNVTPS